MTRARARAARLVAVVAKASGLAALAFASAGTSAVAAPAPPAASERSASTYVRAWLPEARMVGSGRLTWFGLHAYDAALFAPQGRFEADRPFALELTYARDFKGEAIAERSLSEIRKLGKLSESDAAPWSARLRELFPDVRRGDRLTGVAGVDGAARFYLNGRAIGTMDDERLVRAFFAIWLDSRTSAPGLRKQLLGLAGPAS